MPRHHSVADRCGRALASVAAVLLLAGGLLAAPEVAHAAEPFGTVHVVARSMHDPYALAAGPDGNIWFRHHDDSIGRVTPTGATTFFAVPGKLPEPSAPDGSAIAAGPDGNVWYTSPDAHLVGRVTPAGVVTAFTDPTIVYPNAITAGPDGNVWFTDQGDRSVGSITPAGVVSDHPLLSGVSPLGSMTVGAGRVWFTAAVDAGPPLAVVGLAPDGALTILPVSVDRLADLTFGPDGNLWFTTGADSIGRLTPDGVETVFPGGAHPDQGAAWSRGITAGPDGALWVTFDLPQPAGPEWVARYDTDGTFLGTASDEVSRAGDIVTGPDGNVWFTSAPQPDTLTADWSRYLVSMTPTGDGTRFGHQGPYRPRALAAHATDGVWALESWSGPTPLRHVASDGTSTVVATDVGAVATGPDGTTWYSRSGVGIGHPVLVRIAPDGATATFDRTAMPTFDDHLGVDATGNVWFVAGTDVVRMSPTGATTVVGSLGNPDYTNVRLVPALDGSVWLGVLLPDALDSSRLLHLSAAGELSGSLGSPQAMTLGPDGNLWFAPPAPEVVRMTPDEVATAFPVPLQNPVGALTAGPDGALWASDATVPTIWRITTAGAATPVVTRPALPDSLVTAPDGRVWFAQASTSTIGSISTMAFPDPGFSDVPASSPFHDDIAWLVASGLAVGGPGTFRPTAPVSRQALAAFLYRRAGSPNGADPSCGQATFVDVPADDPFCGEIAWFHAAGYTTGYADGTFRPTAPVTRQAMAAFLARSAGGSTDGLCAYSYFEDVDEAQPFCDQIVWLYQHRITTGYGFTHFRPEAAVSRQAMAAFLHRLDVIGGA